MEACRKRWIETFAAITLAMAQCAVAGAEDVIRLPSWVEPTAEADAVEQAAYEPAPRPRAFDHEPKLLSPPARLASISEETDAVRQVRQLEHAASTAQSRHALTRLLKRCDETLVTLEDPTLRQQAERVQSWARHTRGRLTMQAGDAAGALVDLRAAVAANPKNTAALGDLAVALAETGDGAAAMESIDRLLTLDPASVVGLQNRASLRLATGSAELAELAVADCDAALAKVSADAPDRPAVLTTRGVAFHSLGRLREAAADFDEALRLDPKLSPARTARGHVYAEAGFYEQAINDYRGALDADPESIEAYRSLAWVLATCPQRSLRSPQTAIEAAWRARRLLGGEDFLTLDASAAAHASAGEFDEAVRLQQRAVVIADPTAAAEAQQRLRLYQRGKAYVAVGPATLKR